MCFVQIFYKKVMTQNCVLFRYSLSYSRFHNSLLLASSVTGQVPRKKRQGIIKRTVEKALIQFLLFRYSISWNKAIDMMQKTHPGPVTHVSGIVKQNFYKIFKKEEKLC